MAKAKDHKDHKDATPPAIRPIADNRQARRRYAVLEEFEAGIALTGTEVKSLRSGQVNLREGFARIRDGQVYLVNVHISPYSHGNIENHEPTRTRKLLLHRNEINRLIGHTQEKGLTLVPLRLYFKGSHAKVLIGLCRGRKLHDKRQIMRERATKRELDRVMKRAIRR